MPSGDWCHPPNWKAHQSMKWGWKWVAPGTGRAEDTARGQGSPTLSGPRTAICKKHAVKTMSTDEIQASTIPVHQQPVGTWGIGPSFLRPCRPAGVVCFGHCTQWLGRGSGVGLAPASPATTALHFHTHPAPQKRAHFTWSGAFQPAAQWPWPSSWDTEVKDIEVSL